MPRISVDNYDTVASWNGSQDLFVVEQPDGTKVATPAMVKQFIEAGDFTATGEITDGHGNILKDMAKSADVTTALAGKQNTLTFDNAPTANSNNPVKSGGVKTYADIIDQNTMKYVTQITTDAIARGGCVFHNDYFSIQRGCVGLGLACDKGNADNYLLALMYRDSDTSKVKFVYIAHNGLYISATNTGGTVAISGNTGDIDAYSIIFK